MRRLLVESIGKVGVWGFGFRGLGFLFWTFLQRHPRKKALKRFRFYGLGHVCRGSAAPSCRKLTIVRLGLWNRVVVCILIYFMGIARGKPVILLISGVSGVGAQDALDEEVS